MTPLLTLKTNGFRDVLRDDARTQIGLWVGLADANVAELVARCGFDWLLFDAEHGPNDLRGVLSQLRAVAPHATNPVVRPARGDAGLIRRYLDIGAQTLLAPMVETAGQAARLVRAMRYTPTDLYDVDAAATGPSRWNQLEDYVRCANQQMCLLVQAESGTALNNLDAIARTDGVDGVFFEPSELAVSMGCRGADHADVQRAIVDGIRIVRDAGKAAGVLMADRELAPLYIEAGARFVAVGMDTILLQHAATSLARSFGRGGETTEPASREMDGSG